MRRLAKAASIQAATPIDLETWQASASWVQAEGLQIRFLHAGTGPALVLVHGLLGYSFNWRKVIPILAAGRRVIAPDMAGAGFSECRPDLDFSLLGSAKRLIAFLDAAGVTCCDLVGSSYGGSTTLMMAAMARSRVRSLILVAPANPWSQIGRKRVLLLQNPLVASLFPKLARGLSPVHSYWVRRMWGDPQKVSKETLEGYARPLRRPGVFEHAVNIVRTWQPDMREMQAALAEVAGIPSLLIWGSKDRVVDIQSAEPLAKELGGARVAVIEGAGHLPYEECPAEFSQVLQEFLRGIS
ncbi:MAG TPA: alpha/beta fold hydrolase [Terriglobales bacterium]|nr:alpha/beta fold hydrolase [Terriglobales bacterium]